MSGNVTPAPGTALADRTAILRQFATWPPKQQLGFLIAAGRVHTNRAGNDSIFFVVASPAAKGDRRRARSKPKATDASRSA
jgi:hypothetical protein